MPEPFFLLPPPPPPPPPPFFLPATTTCRKGRDTGADKGALESPNDVL
jgi:hypothetical protein